MRDEKLVPQFWKALLKNDQEHVAVKLGYEGLYEYICCMIYLFHKWKKLVSLKSC